MCSTEQLSSSFVLYLSFQPPRPQTLFLSSFFLPSRTSVVLLPLCAVLHPSSATEDICFRIRSDGNSSVDSASRKIYARIFARRCSRAVPTNLPFRVSLSFISARRGVRRVSHLWTSKRPLFVFAALVRAGVAGSATNENNV